MTAFEFLTQPWPWYVAGPALGLTVPLLFLLGGKHFGLSSNLRHVCAMFPTRIEYFRYDWRRYAWNLVFALGIVAGGFLAGTLLANPNPVAISDAAQASLAAQGVPLERGLMPTALFSWSELFTLRGFLLMVVGGFLIGFGTRWAGGCTSGHGITGTAHLQPQSLVALVGFFLGGLLVTHLVLPYLLRL